VARKITNPLYSYPSLSSTIPTGSQIYSIISSWRCKVTLLYKIRKTGKTGESHSWEMSQIQRWVWKDRWSLSKTEWRVQEIM